MQEMYLNSSRKDFYKKDDNLERSLKLLNLTIADLKNFYPNDFKPPIILIMGMARSGSTLLHQLLIDSGLFSFPSNLIARFYSNPSIGILAQQSLIEYDPINQMGIDLKLNKFQSKLGKTIGALAPSEFWYFWREYFKFNENQVIEDDRLNEVDVEDFLNKLFAFQYYTDKPLVMKGMIMNWHIPFLNSIYPNFIFIDVQRDDFLNAQSVLKAREEFFGTRDKWYSFKPREYDQLKDLDPINQVAGQVVYTKREIEAALSNIPDNKKITFSYNDICSDPNSIVSQVVSQVLPFLHKTSMRCTVDFNSFESSNKITLEDNERVILEEALMNFENS